MSNNSSDNSSNDCPWTSDKSEEQRAPGKKSNIFTVNDEEYSCVEDMREKLVEFATKVDRVVDMEGWSADAVHGAIDEIYEYIDNKYDKYQGYLLSGLIERDGTMEIELLLSKEVWDVSYLM